MKTSYAVFNTLFGVFLLGIMFNYMMGTPVIMTLGLYLAGLVAAYYVVVESVRRYRLMKLLTEG